MPWYFWAVNAIMFAVIGAVIARAFYLSSKEEDED